MSVTPQDTRTKRGVQMAKSSKSKKTGKPVKPRPDFPLFPHATGRWAKKVRGRFHYFGKTSDDPKGQVALGRWLEVKDDLLAGRTPRPKGDGLTIADLCNQFLTSKKHLVATEEIKERTFYEYHATCKRIVTALGKQRLVSDLRTNDFEHLRAKLAEGRGPVALGNEINRVRMVFKYGHDGGLIEHPVRYGQSFKRPSRKTLRLARAANGKRMFEAKELQTILDAARQPLKAMIILAMNCAYGQTDIASLKKAAINLETGWIDYPRPKTGVERRTPLWPETIMALRKAFACRPTANDTRDADLAFITQRGHRWVRTYEPKDAEGAVPDDAIGKEFSKLLNRLNLKRPGVSFYALRHTFETIGGESGDQIAVNAIMGHVDDSMASVYREEISNERLIAVTNYVRTWLYGDQVTTSDGEAVEDAAEASGSDSATISTETQ